MRIDLTARSWQSRIVIVATATLLASCVAQTQPHLNAAAPHKDASPLANAVVLVIRHGEKPDEGDQLAPAGVARAKAYVKYFENYKVDGQPLHIDHLFATANGKNSHREVLTVEPLSKALKLDIDIRYKNKAFDKLAEDMKTHAYGHEVLICWHHGNIPALVTALGGDASKLIPGGKWPDAHFDWVVELHYDADGHVDASKSKLVHEHLMPGDAK